MNLHELGVCHNERAGALGVVFDYGLGDIVLESAVAAAVVFGAESRNEAYSAEIELAVLFGEVFVADAVEHLFADFGKTRVYHAEAGALHHGIGYHCAAGGLKIVALSSALVDYLIEHVAVFIYVLFEPFNRLFEYLYKLFFKLLVPDKVPYCIHKPDRIPADGTEPEAL